MNIILKLINRVLNSDGLPSITTSPDTSGSQGSASHISLIMSPAFHSRAIKAAALVGSGLASFARTRRAAETTILTFHGLHEGVGDPAILDWSLHLPVELFRNICSLLAAEYSVISLADLIETRARGERLPDNTVVITFDDGYASTYELAFPILREFELPATVFATTGFLDGDELLWFQRVDLALGRTRMEQIEWAVRDETLRLQFMTREQRQHSLVQLMSRLKDLPDTLLQGEVDRLEEVLGVETPKFVEDLPRPMRPMTWDMACDMSLSGFVDIGGHTHTHPILARCDTMTMRAEIATCRDRIRTEIGDLPQAFAYPNGNANDFTRETLLLVREAGFKAACTMVSGRIDDNTSPYQIPRYGTPESIWEAEATVSGAFETLKGWRQSCLRAMSMI